MIIHSPIISGSLVFAPNATFTLPPGGIYSGSFSGSYQGSSFSGGTFTGNGSGLTFGGTGIVSGSSQVVSILSSLNTYTGSNNTTNTTQNSRLDQLSTASGSAITRLNQLSTYTASNDTTNTTQNSRLDQLSTASGSAITRLSSLETFTSNLALQSVASGTFAGDDSISILGTVLVGNVTQILPTGVVSGSSQVVGILSSLSTYTASNDTTNTTQNSRLTSLETASGSAITRLNLLEVETANLETFTSSINTTIKTRLNVETVVSGSSQVVGILTSLNTYTASNDTTNTTQTSRLNQLSTYTGSNDTTNTTQNSRLDQLSTASGSAITRLNLLEVETANLELYTASNDTKWSTLGSLSGSFARTNSSNIFNGNQTITGSLFISQDLIVQGSSSIQNISSSNLVIGSSFVTLNTFSPSSRFAGLRIIDSGSVGGSGSFLYDSLQDELLFIHRGNGVNTTSSVLLMGPETYDNLGNETYLTTNRLPKGSGKEHLNDSNITDTGTLITLGSNTVITGTILASGTTLVSGSSQIVGSSITTNTVTIGSTAIALGGTATTIAGLTSVTSTGFTGALTGNASTATTLQTARTINGTSFNGSANITIPNLVSGSSQITAGSTTNFATDVKTQLNSNTVVSGSGQINVASTTGDIALGTRTSGNYVATITAGNGIVSSGATTGEGIAHTISAGGGVVSGSSQISHDSTTGYSANRHIDHTSITLTAGDGLTGGGTIADSRTFNVVGTTNRISVSADAVDIASTYVGQTSITTLGTIGTGTWQGSVIASAYLDADTAHLSDTQTFTGAKTFSSAVNITNSTASTTITTGALIVTGGVGVSGALNVGGDVVAYASSDKRLKDNIKNIENPIQKVQKLNGVTWDWNSNADELQQSLPNVGVIAQEVEEVLPQLVHNRDNGFKGVDYAKLTGLLIEAIKEQQKQIDELKSKLV
jgi:hypothetical protein